jgi:hypothetical protein
VPLDKAGRRSRSDIGNQLPVFGDYFPFSFHGTFFGAGGVLAPFDLSQNQVFNVSFWP